MAAPRLSIRRLAAYAAFIAAGIGLAVADLAVVAAAWFAACRLAYVLYVGRSLRSEDRRPASAARLAAEARFARFRRVASFLMDLDGIAFVTLCVVTWGSLPPLLPRGVEIGVGALLVVVGIGVKAWAARSLAAGSYHWRSFFFPDERHDFVASGPYRFLRDPMYTVGYAHTYGAALLAGSLHGLLASAFAQSAILALHALVEAPHDRRVRSRAEAVEDLERPLV